MSFGAPRIRVVRRMVLCGATMFLAAGCANEITLPEDADVEIILGHETYEARCASCHGPDGGGGLGPSLQELETRLSDDEQRDVITNGRKAMPRFEDTLTDEEIDAIVRYSREIL